jgi:hypothetical protein
LIAIVIFILDLLGVPGKPVQNYAAFWSSLSILPSISHQPTTSPSLEFRFCRLRACL